MERTGPYTLYQTPARILNLVRQEGYFTEDVVTAELQAFHTRLRNGRGRHTFPQGKLFYRQDVAITPLSARELRSTPRGKLEIVDPLRDTLERIRTVIAEALREHGALEVLRAGQTSRALKERAGHHHSIGWAPLRGYPGTCCKLTQHAAPFSPGVNALSHPNLAQEYLVDTTHPKRRISLADDASGTPVLSYNLSNQHRERSFKVLTDAMTALEYMHSQGFVHRDFKPENIFMCTTDSGVFYGKLFDLDLALPAGTINGEKTTEMYADGAYFDYSPRGTYERSIDVFAAGISLLLVLGENVIRTRTMLRNLLSEESKAYHRNPDIEALLGRYCNYFLSGCPAEVVAIVKSMLMVDRTERPSISEVLKVLRNAQF